MNTNELILAKNFCTSHGLEFTFMYTLQDFGFIELIEEQENIFIKPEQLPRLEQIVRFNRDLEINLEGIEVIMQLLSRIENLQQETRQLKKQNKSLSRLLLKIPFKM